MSAASTLATGQTLRVNGESRRLPAPPTLAQLLRDMGVGEQRGVAVALNGAVVARSEWPSKAIAAGDRVLVIRATQGG